MNANIIINTNDQSNSTSNNNNNNIDSTSNNGSNNNSLVSPNNRCNLIINYLPQSLKENDFQQLFTKIGPVKTCKLMFDRQTGYSFGYGFVEYVSEEDARKAIDTFNGYQIEHKRLKVALARPNCDETKNTNLYIRNIPLNYDEQQLNDLFSQYGDVVQTRILRDQNTAFSRRIGFVIMATKQMAQVAIQSLDNTVPPNGGTEPLLVKYADEEGKKRGGGGGSNHHGHHNRNNNHHQHHHHHHSNQHNHQHYNQGNFNKSNMNNNNNNNVYMNQQAFSNFNPNNNNITIQQQQQILQNLGKMKTNRSSGHQNRYNPLSGINNQQQIGNNGVSNPWSNMIQQQQPQSSYSNQQFQQTQQNHSTGFENLINTIGGGIANNNNNNNNTSNSYQQQANYLNLNPAAAAAAAAMAAMTGLGGNISNNLLDNNSSTLDSILGGGNSQSQQTNPNNPNIIYVYGVGSSATESDLYALFSHCGRILRVNVIKNPKTGQCKGYGFVVFETYEEAYFAVHNMNGYMYHNRPLQVSLKSFKSINNSNNISNISSSNNSNNNNINNNNKLNISNNSHHQLNQHRPRDKKKH